MTDLVPGLWTLPTHLQNGQETGKPDLQSPQMSGSQVGGVHCTIPTTLCFSVFVSLIL